MLGTKRKKPTTITFSRLPQGSGAGPSTSATAGVLREKTSIRVDGTARQQRSIVPVTVGEQIPRLRPDVLRSREPIYEPFSAADHGGDDGYDDEGSDEEKGRDLRASV